MTIKCDKGKGNKKHEKMSPKGVQKPQKDTKVEKTHNKEGGEAKEKNTKKA